jgi:ribosomal protein L13E
MSWFERTRKKPRPEDLSPSKLAPLDSAGRETRPAHGFSLLEIERAGISEERAHEMGLVLDRRRHSALGSNVAQLKRLVGDRS